MVQSGSTSVAPNTTDSNVISAKRISKIPNDGGVYQVTVAATGSATGLEFECFAGNSNPVERSGVSAQNRVPIVRDDLVAVFEAASGEELTLTAHNTTAGALTFFYYIEWHRVR